MEKIVISKEVALQEVNAWVEFKKLDAKRREGMDIYIENIIAAIMAGHLTIEPQTFVIEHTLKFPLGEKDGVKKLQYKPRVAAYTVQDNMQDVMPFDNLGKTFAILAALSGNSKNIIKLMDTEDLRIASNISIFFVT